MEYPFTTTSDAELIGWMIFFAAALVLLPAHLSRRLGPESQRTD
jgi:hypothetical protein